MRLVVQRVTSGMVTWADAGEQHRATIGLGHVLLVGAGSDDDEATVKRLADKVIDLRVFADEAGRMNEWVTAGVNPAYLPPSDLV